MELLYSISQFLPIPSRLTEHIGKDAERLQESERVTICENSVCWTWKCSCTHELTPRSCGCIHKTRTKSSQPNRGANARQAQELLGYQMSCWQLVASEGVRVSFCFRDVDPKWLPKPGTMWSYTHAHARSTKWAEWVLTERHEDRERGEGRGEEDTWS